MSVNITYHRDGCAANSSDTNWTSQNAKKARNHSFIKAYQVAIDFVCREIEKEDNVCIMRGAGKLLRLVWQNVTWLNLIWPKVPFFHAHDFATRWGGESNAELILLHVRENRNSLWNVSISIISYWIQDGEVCMCLCAWMLVQTEWETTRNGWPLNTWLEIRDALQFIPIYDGYCYYRSIAGLLILLVHISFIFPYLHRKWSGRGNSNICQHHFIS